jgi:hypothetical protein
MDERFVDRIAELDAVVAQCRGRGPFATGVVRDTSNRSKRDWLWWGIQIERTDECDGEKRRVYASIRLNEPAAHVPSVFKAEWWVRIWQGVGVDSFHERGSWLLDWVDATPEALEEAMSALLQHGEAAIARAIADRG